MAEGLGHYTYSDGEYYKGEIKNDKRNGEGAYFYTMVQETRRYMEK